ncbi:hypothetical protein [Mucilaginibacter sp.]|jgi:hypothetical protein|uniref:hypothetical protein n=1 Tax=Mucilaginibacter sp. TaxID=1882438 RepID=UPI003564AE51
MKKKIMNQLERSIVQKELLKQKPVATRFAIATNTWLYDTIITISDIQYQLMFGVPISDMGDKEFNGKEPAHLLFKWYETSHII